MRIFTRPRWRAGEIDNESSASRAIEQRELFLQYQPIVSLPSGEIEHFEALVRWRHPIRGLVSPHSSILPAEETGLIIPLGRWVIEEACRQIQRWQAQLPPGCEARVAVNVASKQFAMPSFVDEVKAILSMTRTHPSALKLEVTESATMSATAVATCIRLEEAGIQIHLDDFGTGYSSLSYLHRMRMHALKIDRSFVATMCESTMNAPDCDIGDPRCLARSGCRPSPRASRLRNNWSCCAA